MASPEALPETVAVEYQRYYNWYCGAGSQLHFDVKMQHRVQERQQEWSHDQC